MESRSLPAKCINRKLLQKNCVFAIWLKGVFRKKKNKLEVLKQLFNCQMKMLMKGFGFGNSIGLGWGSGWGSASTTRWQADTPSQLFAHFATCLFTAPPRCHPTTRATTIRTPHGRQLSSAAVAAHKRFALH